MPSALRRGLRLYFTFGERVDARTYLTHGLGLIALKYALDAGAIYLAARQVWTPID